VAPSPLSPLDRVRPVSPLGRVRPVSAVDRVRREIERNALRARNGIRLAAGVARPDLGQTPKDIVWRAGRSELWRYRNDAISVSPPLLIIYSLFNRSYILDLRPGNSFVERLLAAGFDVFLLDWGVPDERDAANTLEDYVDDYIPAAIGEVLRATGADQVNMLGYCFGGLLSILHAAHHPRSPLRSLSVLTTPADLQQLGPLGDVLSVGGLDVDAILDPDGNVTPRIILQGFRSLAPTADLTRYVNLLERLWSDEYLAADQAMGRWATDHVPLPGGVARQFAQMINDNSLINDRLVIGGDRVHVSDIEVPFLHALANRDHIIPEASSAPLLGLVGSPDKHELRLDAGHIGLVVGRTATKTTMPTIIEFLKQRSEVAACASSRLTRAVSRR
jgi:poly[(R)-3-hydroxyalkanoate] polymerase subunit PhaC